MQVIVCMKRVDLIFLCLLSFTFCYTDFLPLWASMKDSNMRVNLGTIKCILLIDLKIRKWDSLLKLLPPTTQTWISRRRRDDTYVSIPSILSCYYGQTTLFIIIEELFLKLYEQI